MKSATLIILVLLLIQLLFLNLYVHDNLLFTQSFQIECEADVAKCRNINVPSKLVEAMTCRFDHPTLPLFIHFSTDQVFSGKKPFSTEEDLMEPANAYGHSKKEAEEYLLRELPNVVILRTSIIYGPEAPLQPVPRPLFLQFLAQNLESLSWFTDEYRNPVYIGDILAVVDYYYQNELKKDRRLNQVVLNLGGPERLSRYDMALRVAKYFGISEEKVRTALSNDTNRGFVSPPDTSMDSSKLIRETGIQTTKLEDNLPACLPE